MIESKAYRKLESGGITRITLRNMRDKELQEFDDLTNTLKR